VEIGLQGEHHRAEWLLSAELQGTIVRPVMAASVSTRQRQEADSRPGDMPRLPDEARAAVKGCAARQADLACRAAGKARRSDLCLLRDLQGVVHLDAKVPDRRFKFAMAKEQLHGPQVLRASVDQRRLGSPHMPNSA